MSTYFLSLIIKDETGGENMDENQLKEQVLKSKEVIDKNFKKTYKEFMEVTNHDELLIVILRGHLYIERELIKILGKVFDDDTYNNLTFAQKVDLCNSLGLIEKEKIGSLRKLNKQRNGFAHSLEFRLEEKDYEDLLSTLSKEEKVYFKVELERFYSDHGREKSLKDNYRILLASIWSAVHMDNMFFFALYKLRSEKIIDREYKLLTEETDE